MENFDSGFHNNSIDEGCKTLRCTSANNLEILPSYSLNHLNDISAAIFQLYLEDSYSQKLDLYLVN
ncbi:hypothetical protein DERF_012982 [Dermatophagoides farinae]|uniref:Uncharacterized protein n=1 Tax=Dermatophagoides farinae TaxID=6954 RepID=A0A922HP80_DERFA|nr:hypothetical protein DERF_012982 [Dermatophagoides farinae]